MQILVKCFMLIWCSKKISFWKRLNCYWCARKRVISNSVTAGASFVVV